MIPWIKSFEEIPEARIRQVSLTKRWSQTLGYRWGLCLLPLAPGGLCLWQNSAEVMLGRLGAQASRGWRPLRLVSGWACSCGPLTAATWVNPRGPGQPTPDCTCVRPTWEQPTGAWSTRSNQRDDDKSLLPAAGSGPFVSGT